MLLAFTQNSNVFFLNLATHVRTVVTTKGRDDGTGATYPWYGWSPDGKYFALLRINDESGAKVPQNLLILDRTGTVLHTLAGGSGDFYPAWAVDGDQVAYIADSGYDHGRAYFDVDAADAGGHVRHLWRSSNAQFCDAGEGALDPAAGLAVREATLDRSLRWSLTSGLAYYSSPCSPGLQVVSVRNGATTVLGAGQEWHSPALSRAGVLAVVGQPGGPNGAPAVELVRPSTGAVLASLGSGETPSWSADGKSLYYQMRTAQSTIAFGSGTTAMTTTRYLASIYRAPADGSGHSVVVRVDAYYLAGLSQVPGNGGVVFSAVGNDTERSTPLKMGESLDKAWREANQPNVNVERVDASGRVTIVVPDAGLPAVQPVAMH